MTKVIFIGATGTDIGKTYVTCLLLRQLRKQGYKARAIKPVISGFDVDALDQTDTGLLLKAMDRAPTLDNARMISPWRYAPPLPPHIAARQIGETINFEEVTLFCQKQATNDLDFLLIEGAGGIMVPLNYHHTTLDLMVRLGGSCLLVAGSALGTISHSLTALSCLDQRGIDVAGLIISESPQSYINIEDVLQDFTKIIPNIPIRAIKRHDQTTEISNLVI
ncbi:MAG: dethiobiotin synthase [Emcibacter sp.]|nr:dethiobiotin synthase [Emcibacter sp.]